MPTFDAYVSCACCGGQGFWWKNERVGEQVIKTPIPCDLCGGKGQILASKLRDRPLYDRFGRPIDQLGRELKNPEQEPWARRMRRKQWIEEHGAGRRY